MTNFHPFEVVERSSATQLQVDENLKYLTSSVISMISNWPDSDNLTNVKWDAVHLSNKDGGHSLVQGGAVHVDGRPYGDNKPCYTLVYSVVFLQTAECDGHRGRTEK